jgi:hypothetical protein
VASRFERLVVCMTGAACWIGLETASGGHLEEPARSGEDRCGIAARGYARRVSVLDRLAGRWRRAGLERGGLQIGAARVANQARRVMLVTRWASPSLAVARARPTERMIRPNRHFWAAKTCSTATRTRAPVAL